MDDISKLFGGFDSYNKIMGRSKSMTSIEALFNPLHISNFIKEPDENFALKAIAGNSLQLWESVNKISKTPDYIGMSTMEIIKHSIDNVTKTNSALHINSLVNPILATQLQLIEKNNQRSEIFSGVMGNTASMLAAFNNRPKIPDYVVNVFGGNNWYNHVIELKKVHSTIDDLSLPLLNFTGAFQKNKSLKSSEFIHERETLNKSKDRFVSNVSKLITEIREIEEDDLNDIQVQFDKALKQEISVAVVTPISFYIFEFILNNYSEIIEDFLQFGDVSNRFIKSFLQTSDINSADFSAMNWIFINIVVVGCGSAFVYDKIKNVNQKNSLANVTVNAKTNNTKKIHSKPHGNSKVLCEIPESSTVLIGASKGQYIEIRVQLNGSTYIGWTLNEGISER